MRIGSYQVLFELGRGGMGTVYLGRVRGTGDFERLVAIKRQRAPETGFDEPPERFLLEARLAGLVHHANVVGMHQAGIDEEGYYFVCDYVEGLSLSGLVSRNVPHPLWPVPIVARVMLDALAGLQAVHDAVDAEGNPLGMLHRDLATDNLLVGRDGVTRLADFGIARVARGAPLTEEGQVRGKLPYLAPEYLRAQPLDKSFDVYAAGVTLWVALGRQLPFGNKSEVHMMQSILNEGVPPLADIGRSYGPALDAVVARACHPIARERYQSAREMLDALESAALSIGTIARHVQVAEYVESVAGQDLATRRAKIHAHRRALDAGDAAPSELHRVRPVAVASSATEAPTVLSRVPTMVSMAPPPSKPLTFTRPAPSFSQPSKGWPVSTAQRAATPVRTFTPPARPLPARTPSRPTAVPHDRLPLNPTLPRLARAVLMLLLLLAGYVIGRMILLR